MARNFIIVEPDPIVCMDVEGMLVAQYPGAQVVAGASFKGIGAAIDNSGPDSTLFVKGALVTASDDLRRVLQAAATRGSRIVIIGESKAVNFPAIFLELPFTTDIVIAVVDRDVPTGESDLVP